MIAYCQHTVNIVLLHWKVHIRLSYPCWYFTRGRHLPYASSGEAVEIKFLARSIKYHSSYVSAPIAEWISPSEAVNETIHYLSLTVVPQYLTRQGVRRLIVGPFTASVRISLSSVKCEASVFEFHTGKGVGALS